MKKLMSLLLVAAMVFGLFGTIGTAFAAPVFPDIAGHANEKDIVKLYTLGVIGGYPDGTFKPEGNITRAEFAKIVVLSLGKGGSANLLKNTASQFKDVPAAQWYTGYVNVAVANSIIKGYADGTFKPEANISEAEAVTMILRAMGYNDNLPGTWPLNYVMKAADLSIIDDTFVADTKATRAFVCDSTVAMLGYSKAVYTSTTNTFTDSVANGALLAALSGTVVVNNAQVASYNSTTGALTLVGVVTPIKVAAGVKVATGEALSDLANKYINYMKHTVDATDEIIYIEVKTPVVAGKVASIDAVNNQFTLTNGTIVKMATTPVPTITLNGTPSTLIGLKDADVTALLGADGKAYSVVGYQLTSVGAITGKQTTVTNGTTATTITFAGGTYTVASTTTVVRNGAVATFADLKVGDDVQLSADATNKAVYVDAYAMTKKGVVTSIAKAADNTVLSVTFADGTTVAVATGATGAPVVGETFTVTINRAGKISAFGAGSVVANTVSGKIVAVGTTVTATATTSYITLDNGTTYTLLAAATYEVNNTAAAITNLAKDQLAVLSLDSAGKVSFVDAFVNGTVTLAVLDANDDSSTTYKLNTVASTFASLLNTDTINVTWDITTGKIATADAYRWLVSGETVVGTVISTDGAGHTTYTVNAFLTPTTVTPYVLASDFVVIKDGVVATFDSIKIGDKVNVGFDSKLVKVTTDAKFGTDTDLTNDVAITNDTTLTFEDVVKSVKVMVNGVDWTATAGNTVTIGATGKTATLSGAGLAAGSGVVGILVTDYAGNTATFSATR